MPTESCYESTTPDDGETTQLPFGGAFDICSGPDDLCKQFAAMNPATGAASCPNGYTSVALLPSQVRSCARKCDVSLRDVHYSRSDNMGRSKQKFQGYKRFMSKSYPNIKLVTSNQLWFYLTSSLETWARDKLLWGYIFKFTLGEWLLDSVRYFISIIGNNYQAIVHNSIDDSL